MKTIYFSLPLLAAFFVVSIGAQTASVISEKANLRGTPSQTGSVVSEVSEGQKVSVIKQTGAWFLVQTSKFSGWLHGNTIKFSGSKPAAIKSVVEPPTGNSPATLVRRSPVQIKRAAAGNYILGPRGGCYYINGNGNKTYVDHSLCN